MKMNSAKLAISQWMEKTIHYQIGYLILQQR